MYVMNSHFQSHYPLSSLLKSSFVSISLPDNLVLFDVWLTGLVRVSWASIGGRSCTGVGATDQWLLHYRKWNFFPQAMLIRQRWALKCHSPILGVLLVLVLCTSVLWLWHVHTTQPLEAHSPILGELLVLVLCTSLLWLWHVQTCGPYRSFPYP